jgi:hypothetical protein
VTALLERLEAGDHDAAQPLRQRYYPRLVGLARQRLRGTPRRVADEQDVALSAWSAWAKARVSPTRWSNGRSGSSPASPESGPDDGSMTGGVPEKVRLWG